MTIVLIAMLLAILVCLGSALLFVFRDEGQHRLRAVAAMGCTVALSFALFVLLMIGMYFEWLPGHALNRMG